MKLNNKVRLLVTCDSSAGAGKTTAAKILKRKMKAYLFDADKEAKSHLLSSLPLQNKLINIFGPEIKGENGRLNPKQLAKYAFENESNQQILNGILNGRF